MRILPIAAIVCGLAASAVWTAFLGYSIIPSDRTYVLGRAYSTSVMPASSRLDRKKPRTAPIKIPRDTPVINTARRS